MLNDKAINTDAGSTTTSSIVSQKVELTPATISRLERKMMEEGEHEPQPAGTNPNTAMHKANNQQSDDKLAEDDDDETSYMSGWPLYLIISGLALAILLVALDNAILATAIPTITARFNSLDDVGWYGSAYLMTTCALQPLSGKIYRFFSLKGTFLVFLAIFELGSLVCATAPSSAALIIGRAIAGAGSAGIFSGALTIIAHTIEVRMRPTYTGILISMFAIAGIAGPVLGGALTQHVSWRWCFYINLPAGAITTALLILYFHPASRKVTANTPLPTKIRNLDLLSLIFFVPAVTFLLLALQWGGTKHPWKSGIIIGFLVAAFVMFVLFAIWESFQEEDRASIPGVLIKDRSLMFSIIAGFMVMGGMQVLIYYNPIYFQVVQGVSPTESGIKILPMIMGSLLFNIICGIAVTKTGIMNPWMYAGFSVIAIGTGLMSTYGPHTPTAEWAGKMFLTGAGMGMTTQTPIIAVQNLVPMKRVSVATAFCVAMQFLGGAISLTIAESVFSSKMRHSLPQYAPKIPVQDVLGIGASDVRTMIPAESVDGVILAYCKSIDSTFYVTVAMACAGLFASFGVKWVVVGKNEKKQKGKDIEEQKKGEEKTEA